MTYSAGGLIQAADFNAILNSNTPNFNGIWSAGSGSSGYGQTAIGSVVATAPVAASSWNSLITNMAATATHQGSTITALTPPVAGDDIAYLAAIATNMTTLNTSRLNCAAVGTDITNSATRVAPWGSGQGIPTLTSIINVTFSNDAAARYFFNAGGSILLSASNSGGAGGEDIAWNNLCTDIGTIGLPAVNTAQTLAAASYQGLTKFGGGGSAPTIYVRNGFYNLPTLTATWFRQYSNYSVYTNDYIEIGYSYTGTGSVRMRMTFVDTSTFFANTVNGSLQVTATARQPESTNISNSWGTPTVTVTAPA
jgi:hypothetical protein